MKKDKEYAIRCFIDGKRKFTRLFTPNQAKIFYNTAGVLRRYIKRVYFRGKGWGMKTVCAWCLVIIKKGKGKISHGMCKKCQKLSSKERDKLARKRRVIKNELM